VATDLDDEVIRLVHGEPAAVELQHVPHVRGRRVAAGDRDTDAYGNAA
jgi:hypothetical protein